MPEISISVIYKLLGPVGLPQLLLLVSPSVIPCSLWDDWMDEQMEE